jgi:choline/glycine/proline betaine transport protein
MEKRGREAIVTQADSDSSVSLTVPAHGVRDFVYGVQPVAHRLPAFSAAEATQGDFRYEARTFFSDGSRGYDLMGMTREHIITDVLTQFDRYLQIVQTPATSLVVGAPEHAPEVTAPDVFE